MKYEKKSQPRGERLMYKKTYSCDIGESQTGGRVVATVYEPEVESVTERVRGSVAVQGDGPETLDALGTYRGHGTLIPNLPTYHLVDAARPRRDEG